MKEGLNQVTILGTVGHVELKSAGDTPLLSLRMAVNERRKQGEEWVEHVEWVSATLFGKRASALAPYINKGDPLFIVGKLRTKTVEKDGKKTYFTGVAVDEVRLLGSKKDGNTRSQSDDMGFGDTL